MITTIKEVKKFLKENYLKYNIVYEESIEPKYFILKGRKIRLPISKEELKKEYERIYKVKK